MEKEKGKKKISFFTILIIVFIIIVIINFLQMKRDDINYNKKVESISTLPNRHYYNQLEGGYKKDGKYIYNKLYADIESLKNGKNTIYLDDYFSDALEENKEEGYKYLSTSFSAAKVAFKDENPELFFLDPDKMELTVIESDKYRVTINCNEGENYFIDGISSRKDVEKMENEIKSATSNIMSELKGLNNNYDKIKKVHDYLIDTIEYTENTENARDIYGALVNKKCVCEGYARAFQYFMNELNIESVYVVGMAHGLKWSSSANHTWNYVKLNNEWYAVDTTWDDNENKYDFFLKGKEKMKDTHVEKTKLGDRYEFSSSLTNRMVRDEELISYPTLSEKDYE